MLRFAVYLATCVLLLWGCGGDASSPTGDANRPAPTVAEVDLAIGVAEGEAPYMFGRISSVVADEQGRIFAADRQGNHVRAYDSDGVHLFDVATAGEGPGEVNSPCCLAFGPDGDLWIRDDQNRRYSQYEVTDEGASQIASVQMGHAMSGLQAATTFDANGNVIDVGTRRIEGMLGSIPTRFHQREDGTTVRTVRIPQPPDERLSIYETETGGGIARYTIPGGAQALDAHAPNSNFAYAVNDRYEIVRADANGDTLHVLRRSPQPIERSAEEEEEIRETIESLTQRFDASTSELEQLIPEHKPPLESIFFDAQSRLWVQRAVPEGAPKEADVYDQDGTLSQVVQWPNDVFPARGHIQGNRMSNREPFRGSIQGT